MTASLDVIDDLVGIVPGSSLDRIRAGRPQARVNAQASYEALFAPADPSAMALAERFAVATFVAGLHESADIRAFYARHLARLGDSNFVEGVAAAIVVGRARGPYGAYPPGPLSTEDQPGPALVMPPAALDALHPRLTAALAHVHMLVFHPRDASPEALQALLDAGWTTTGIVTLSQIVAFLSFQIRVVEGLKALLTARGKAQ